MIILEKMEGKLTTLGSALSAISRDVYNLQSKSISLQNVQVLVSQLL